MVFKAALEVTESLDVFCAAIAALLGRFLPGLGPLVATQAAFFV
jgi:hypothetical protein